MKKIGYFCFYIVLSLGVFNAFSTISAENIPAGPQIQITPPYLNKTIDLNTNTTINQQFKITTTGIDNPKVEISFLESNPNLTKSQESSIFKELSKINTSIKADDIIIDTEFDLRSLSDKTYFFILKINLNSIANKTNIQGNLEINIPCIFTINKDLSLKNLKPDFALNSKNKFYFNPNNIQLKSQIINQSDKILDFGGEILALDDTNTIVYSEPVMPTDSTLISPKSYKEKDIYIKSLPKKGFLPYFGKLNFVIRGTVNNERHIETDKISIWIIPYQLIVLAASAILLITISFLFLMRKVRIAKKQKLK